MKSDDVKATAKDGVAKAGKAGEAAADEVSQRASSTGDVARDYASSASETAAGLYGAAKSKINDASAQLPDSASAAIDAGHKVYASGAETLVNQVTKQPIEALLLAGAIGYLVGWAANRS